MSNYKEIDLEEFIENHLVDVNKYTKRDYHSYNKELCLDEELLFEFLESTQKEKLDELKNRIGVDYKKQFTKRLFKKIAKEGIVNILRSGISENGIKFDLIYDKPQTSHNPQTIKLYNDNIFSVTRQLHYSTKNNNSLDINTSAKKNRITDII